MSGRRLVLHAYVLFALLVGALAGTSVVARAAEAVAVAEAERPVPVVSALDVDDDGMAVVEAGADAEPEKRLDGGDDLPRPTPALVVHVIAPAVLLALERGGDGRVADEHVLGWSTQLLDHDLSARGPPTAC